MSITVVGLGPSDMSYLTQRQRDVLLHPDTRVILRTLSHPAAEELAGLRSVESCDDLYESLENFDEIYEAIVQRIVSAAADRDVIYGVPGSSSVGERSVSGIQQVASEQSIHVTVIPGVSFLDLAYTACKIDPIADSASPGRDYDDQPDGER